MNDVESGPPTWGLWRRIGFRFLFCYVLLYLLPFPIEVLVSLPSFPEGWRKDIAALAVYETPREYVQKGVGWALSKYASGMHETVKWTGKSLFGLDITVLPNGSGDTTYNYVQVACFGIAAAVLAALWSLVDRRRERYSNLHGGLRVYVRYSLALTMVGYGLAKVFKSQFPTPDVDRLMQPYGDSSPMGLLWTFMGASTPYTFFAGAMECLGGLLLVFRRTTTLGSLVVFGVMLNVALMNFCYDVPVKLYSAHLLLMSVFLMAPDSGRLVNLLVMNRATQPVELGRVCRNKWLYATAMAGKLAFLGITVVPAVLYAREARRTWGDDAPKPAMYGLYDVEEFSIDGTTIPPTFSETRRWRRVAFNRYGAMMILQADDSRRRFSGADDAAAHTMTLKPRFDPAKQFTLKYEKTADGALQLAGKFEEGEIVAKLKLRPDQNYLLVNRGFHWINEYPHNR